MEKKLRLMCSYGGHIMPRPHSKTLCYAGGETRLIAVDRSTASASVSSLTSYLTSTLNLTSAAPFTIKYQLPHQDLDSLISISTQEDLLNMLDEYDRLLASPTPARIRFFLFSKNTQNSNAGNNVNVAEDWFVDALKSSGFNNGSGESVVVEERDSRDRDNSSFGSTGSSASAGNNLVVAPVGRVCGGGGGGGGVGGGEEIKVVLPSLDSLGSDISIPSPNYSQQGIVYQDASGFPESRAISAHLVETDSNASDRSPRSDMLTPAQVSSYILSKSMDQAPKPVASPPPLLSGPTQYVHHQAPQPHYVTQYYPNSVSVASYPTMYQPCVQAQQPVQYLQMNKPFPVYMMPVGQSQNPYDMSVQHSVAPSHTANPSQHQLPSNPVMVASPMGYEGYKPAAPAPEYGAKVYRPTPVPAQPVAAPTDDHLHQVVAFPSVNSPAQPVVVSPLENSNYINEYEDPMHAQIYKTQPSGPTLPTQLQTTTNAGTVMLAESFTQLKVDNTKN